MTELSDDERRRLSQLMRAQHLVAKSLGHALHGDERVTAESVVAEIPGSPAGRVSVCGQKDYLIDQVRRFIRDDGSTADVRCAAVAVLKMTDSPVHFHAATTEHYIVLAGSGKMILGEGETERVVPVRQGSVLLLPPGQPHGIVSDSPDEPVTALLTFSPGLAPRDAPEFRDEQIVHARTSARLTVLQAESEDAGP